MELFLLYKDQPEVQNLTSEVKRLVDDIKSQMEENLAERDQNKNLFDQYDEKSVSYN